MSMENIDGKLFATESYPIEDIGGGVVSKGQAVRHYEKKHPEHTVVSISSFKIDHQDETIKIRVLVKKKAVVLPDDNQKPVGVNPVAASDAKPYGQKLLNPGYNELLESRNHLIDELAESEKQLLELQKAHEKLLKEYEHVEKRMMKLWDEKMAEKMEVDLSPMTEQDDGRFAISAPTAEEVADAAVKVAELKLTGKPLLAPREEISQKEAGTRFDISGEGGKVSE